MRKLILLVALSILTNFSFSQSQADMNLEASTNYKKADKKLNSAYQIILKEYGNDTVFIKNFKRAQKIWIQYRDAQMAAKYPHPNEYGSVFPMCYPMEFQSLQQLKNAGGLRLIRKRMVVDSITRYDVSLRSLNQMAENEMSIIVDYRTIAPRVYNSSVLDKMMDPNNIPSPPTDNPPLVPFTKSDLNDFNYKLFGIKAINRAGRREMNKVLSQARNLLTTLKKEYHLK